MNSLYQNKYGCFFLLVLLSFSACKKENVEATKELYSYISPDFSFNPTVSLNAYLNYNATAPIISKIDSPIVISSPIRLARPYTSDVNVSFKPSTDSALLRDYNAKYGTNYQLLPDISMVHFSSLQYVIKAGSTAAEGAISIVANLAGLPKTVTKSETLHYLLPVLMENESKGVQTPTKRNIFYVVLHVNKQLVNINPAGSLEGLQMIDRSNWSVKTSAAIIPVPTYTIDGDYNTAWVGGGSENFITYDMKSSHDIKGVSFAPVYLYGTYYNNKYFIIETSTDGVNFAYQGEYLKQGDWGGTETNPEIVKLPFYNPVKAQYIRVRSSQGDSGYGGMSEFAAFN